MEKNKAKIKIIGVAGGTNCVKSYAEVVSNQ